MLGDPQIVPIPFSGGVNQRDREETLQPGEMRALDCYQMTKSNGYQKAPGNDSQVMSIVGGGTIRRAGRLMSFRGEELLTGSPTVGAVATNLYSFNPQANNWRNAGLIPPCSAKRTGVGSFSSSVTSQGLVFINGHFVVFWTTLTALNWIVVNATTLGRVANGTVVVAGAIASIGSVGTQAFIFYVTTGTGNLNMIQFNTATLTMAAFVTVDTDVYTGAALSIDVATLSDRIAVAYNNNSGTVNSITVQTFNAPANVITQIAVNYAVPSVNPPFGPLSIGGSAADELFVASSQSAIATNVRALLATTLALNGTAATCIAFAATSLGVARTSATTGFLWSTSITGGGPPVRLNTRTFTLTAGAIVAGPGPVSVVNSFLYSKPFLVGARWYGMVLPFLGGLNQTRFCVDITEFQANGALPTPYPVATISPQLSAGGAGPTQSAAAMSATKFAFAGASLRTPTTGSIDIDIIDFADPDVCQVAPYGNVISLSGGTPYTYDGATTAEQGFCASPGTLTSVVGAGVLPAGIYGYCVVWEHLDAAGQMHRSAPSPVLNVTSPGGATTSNVVTTDGCPFSARQGGIVAALYRTTVNGTVLYRVPVATINVTPNTTSSRVAFADDATADTVLQTQAPLYTQPAILGSAVPRTAPPSLSSLISHQDRLVGVADDGKTIWVSGQQIDGDGLWWSSFAGFQYPQQRGPITAMASMDGRLITWTRDEPAVLDGQGPPDNGQGGGYITSQLVSDVGCISQRSVCVTTGGVIFQSLRGLERLNRSLQVDNYFGARVEDTLTANPVITSAIVQQANGRVIFTCLPSEGSATGLAIEWDLTNQLWTVCGRLASDGFPGAGVQSACNIGGPGQPQTYTWVTRAGQAYQESTTSALEDGDYKPTRLLTPWIHVQGLTGWQHVDTLQILAKSLSAHDLRVRIAYDYSPNFTDSKSWTATQIAALTTAREVLQVDLTQPECTAIQVEIVDSVPTGVGAGSGFGPALIGLNLLARGDDGLSKLPEENRK